jgi:glycosyltransferase involved in cell wall biosynthesis
VLRQGTGVAVNLLWCVPGDVGGSEEYLVRQLVGFAEAAPHIPATLYVGDRFVDAHPQLAELFPTVVAPFGGASRARRIAGEITWFRRQASAAGLRHHGGGTAPLGATRPFVLTIHDLQYRTFPQYFTRKKRAYLSAMIGRSVRRARLVAVPSDYVRASVIEAYRVEESRVRVVPHGFEPGLRSDITDEGILRERYDLDDRPVIVYPAVTNPHKNHQFLIDLLATAWRDVDVLLVLIGGSGSAEAAVRSAADPRIRRLGRVPAADRNGLLKMAEAMVFPSQYEGFGAPLIEAMALGCPVIASDSTCIPAIVDGAGLVLPLQADVWADALDRVTRDRATMIAAGLRRSQAFTARASGEALGAVYADAMEPK